MTTIGPPRSIGIFEEMEGRTTRIDEVTVLLSASAVPETFDPSTLTGCTTIDDDRFCGSAPVELQSTNTAKACVSPTTDALLMGLMSVLAAAPTPRGPTTRDVWKGTPMGSGSASGTSKDGVKATGTALEKGMAGERATTRLAAALVGVMGAVLAL